MASCHYCAYGEGGHNKVCPESLSGEAKVQAHKKWDAGYYQARAGLPMPTDASATYSLGYGRGVVALEEADNGYDPRFEDPVDPSEEEMFELDDFDDPYWGHSN